MNVESKRPLRGRSHDAAIEKAFHPSFDMRQIVTDRHLIPLASDEERDVGDVGERVLRGDVLSTLHFAIEILEVPTKLCPGFFDLIVVGDITRGSLHAGVAVVDPNSYVRPGQWVFGHQRRFGILFFQVLVDNRGLVNNRITIDQNRNFAVGI